MTKKYLSPSPLKQGDMIRIIAPAGPVLSEDAIYRGKHHLETMGYRVSFGKNLFHSNKYLSDTDENRLSDLHNAFEDKDVNAIICARGGYGSLRLINKIDYDLIINNPKIFCGYSDITVLSLMFLKHSSLLTYSSPMIKGDFGAENVSQYTMNNFVNTVVKRSVQTVKSLKVHNNGNCEGILWGGNLASVASLAGTDFIPDDGFIFFAEDVNEPVYKIDKMFTQLMNIPKFKMNIKGIILGEFIDNGYPDQLNELFDEIASKLSVPTLSGFNITHDKEKLTIPVGGFAKIESDSLIF